MSFKALIPVDGSESSKRAVEFAISILQPHPEARVTLLYVYDSGGITDLGLEALSREEVDEAKARLAREIFSAPSAAMQAAGIAFETEVRLGNPAEEILSTADMRSPDCIFVGSHGHTRFVGHTLGGVTDRVLRHARCPVIVVRY